MVVAGTDDGSHDHFLLQAGGMRMAKRIVEGPVLYDESAEMGAKVAAMAEQADREGEEARVDSRGR